MIEFVGMIGALLFGCACIPMAFRAWQHGNATFVPTSTIWLFFSACVFYFGYLFLAFGYQMPFLIGVVETACWGIVIKYRYWPRAL